MDEFAWVVVGSVAGVAGVAATIVFAIIPLVQGRRKVRLLPARYGRVARQWEDPLQLGVHRVISGGPMPAYVRRPHDELLRAVLDPAEQVSRLVVIRGGSSTGKTRAAYEAVIAVLADWQLDYPLNAAALAARLDAGVAARTVLWLGELRQYADDSGGAAALGRLADLLCGDGILAVTTVWPEQWGTYTAAARAGPGTADPAGVAGRLLEPLPNLTGDDPAKIDPARGGVIDVPDHFTAADLRAAARTGDRLLTDAVAAAARAGQAGQVTQYLAGVPALLARYNGPGGDPYGQAIITAAMDATRLGRTSPLPAALIQEAAVGYLTSSQRSIPLDNWRGSALNWATAELNGQVRALQPVPPPSGTGVVGYQVADYLEQHGRRTRQYQTGRACLWDALIAHTSTADDLTRLGQAAEDRGFYRQAAVLWTQAIASAGNTTAAYHLFTLLHRVNPGGTTYAAHWIAQTADVHNAWDVAALMQALSEAQAYDAVTTLAQRATHTSVDNPRAVEELLRELRRSGNGSAITTLAQRAAAHTNLDNRRAVEELLKELRHGGNNGSAVTTLAQRAAAHNSLQDPGVIDAITKPLPALTETLLARQSLRKAENSDRTAITMDKAQAIEAMTRDALMLIDLDNPIQLQTVARTLEELGKPGKNEEADILASLDNPTVVARLLVDLRKAGHGNAVTILARRAADAGMFSLVLEICPGEAHSYPYGRDPDGTPSQSWTWRKP